MTKRRLWRMVRLGAAVALIVLGIVGLVLPVLQGTLFLVIGLTLLARDSERARRLLEWVRGRLPGRLGRSLGGLRDGGINDAR